jgi:Flp pilus assembly pilin Flp
MNPTIKRFWNDEAGAEMVEWAVVTIILLTATVWILMALRDLLNDVFKSIFLRLQEDPDDAWKSP